MIILYQSLIYELHAEVTTANADQDNILQQLAGVASHFTLPHPLGEFVDGVQYLVHLHDHILALELNDVAWLSSQGYMQDCSIFCCVDLAL